MNLPLQDKIAIVTGAAGTMGAAAARFLLQDGCSVALFDINAKALDELTKTFSGRVLPVTCDISDQNAVGKACDLVRAEFGDPDILINNAGILTNNKIMQTNEAEWHKILGINLDAAFYLAQQVIPAMKTKAFPRLSLPRALR